jgi:hypothetical protein
MSGFTPTRLARAKWSVRVTRANLTKDCGSPPEHALHVRGRAAGMSVERLAARSRAEAEHELAPSRAVFFPLPACRSRDVPGYHLRMHPEVQAETAGYRAETPGRTAIASDASYAGSHPARFNGSNSAHIRAFRVDLARACAPCVGQYWRPEQEKPHDRGRGAGLS